MPNTPRIPKHTVYRGSIEKTSWRVGRWNREGKASSEECIIKHCGWLEFNPTGKSGRWHKTHTLVLSQWKARELVYLIHRLPLIVGWGLLGGRKRTVRFPYSSVHTLRSRDVVEPAIKLLQLNEVVWPEESGQARQHLLYSVPSFKKSLIALSARNAFCV